MLRKEDFEPNMETEDKIPGAQPENPAQSQRFGDFIVNICRMSRIPWNFFRGHLFRRSMRFFGGSLCSSGKYGRT